MRSYKIVRIGEKSFHSMRNLEYLLIDSNQLEHLDANTFDDLQNLKALGLALNKLKSVNKQMFAHLKGLVHLGIFNEYEISSFRFDFDSISDSVNESNVSHFIREAVCLDKKYICENFNSPVTQTYSPFVLLFFSIYLFFFFFLL